MLWLRGHAIYAAHFIVVVFVASMLVTSILMAVNLGHLLSALAHRLARGGLGDGRRDGNEIFRSDARQRGDAAGERLGA